MKIICGKGGIIFSFLFCKSGFLLWKLKLVKYWEFEIKVKIILINISVVGRVD